MHWQDVLVWRNQIYNIVINSFGSMTHLAANLHQLGYKVRPQGGAGSCPAWSCCLLVRCTLPSAVR